MKITDVSPFLLRGEELYGSHEGAEEATDQGDWLLLVRVRTDDGIEGWSDIETFGPVGARVIRGDTMSAMGFRTIADVLVGRDPLEVEQRWQELYIATAYYGRRGVAMQCISAVDNCLWSIRAQSAGVDLATALGGRRRDFVPPDARGKCGRSRTLRGAWLFRDEVRLGRLRCQPGAGPGQPCRDQGHARP
jgi:L-rhamnonate dehydratase